MGRGLSGTDVTVCPDWTGLPWVCPFWTGVSAMPEKSRPHSTRAHTRQKEVTKFVEAEKELPEILPWTAGRRLGE